MTPAQRLAPVAAIAFAAVAAAAPLPGTVDAPPMTFTGVGDTIAPTGASVTRLAAVAQVGTTPVPVAPSTRSADLTTLPDAQVLVFPNGLRMSAGQLRTLTAKPRAPARGAEMLRKAPAGPVVDVDRGAALAQLERSPPQTLLRLPDGRTISAAQLKSYDEALARARPTASRAPPSAARVIPVPRGTPIAELLAHPDAAILESPGGKRITVGELRRYLSGSAGNAPTQRQK